MTGRRCPGLRGRWLNGWLAAVGATVLCPSLRLDWTQQPSPVGVLTSDDDRDVAQSVAAALPDEAELSHLAIAREVVTDGGEARDLPPMPRKVPMETFRARARLARERHDPFLAASLSDLVDEDECAHSPFDPSVPRGVTLHDRLLRCVSDLPADSDARIEAVVATLDGTARRVEGNGLGFDYLRLPAQAEGGALRVDPTVETLAFFALALFPARGDGRRVRVRGWTSSHTQRGAFTWPVWREPLDRWAIDALLDRWYKNPETAPRYGVTAAYRSVPYQPTGSGDVTRAYTSERCL